MPMTKSLASYAPIRLRLEAARAAGGARFQPFSQTTGEPSKGVAVRWRQSAYTYRTLLTKADVAAHAAIPGYIPSTPWDDMILRIDPADPTFVIIEFGTGDGAMLGLDGKPITAAPSPTQSQSPDALVDEALALVNEKGQS